MDKFGYQRGFDIFNRHLDTVSKICQRYGLHPMIWSDMYFRMGSKTMDYYDPAAVIPPEVGSMIPKSVDLVYWDYYHTDKDFYLDWIRQHRKLGFEPLMASGVWTWSRFWYDHRQTVATVTPCIEACRDEKVGELFFTLWGDDGAYCEYDSCLAGLAWAAEFAWHGHADEQAAAEKFATICADDYHRNCALGELEYPCGTDEIPGHLLLWDDPLLGINWNNNSTVNPQWAELAIQTFKHIVAQTESSGREAENADLDHIRRLLRAMIGKLELRRTLLDAYARRDRAKLEFIAHTMVPEVMSVLKSLLQSFRRQWMRRNKTFGFETIQLRLNAQIGRYEEIGVRIEELLYDGFNGIPELDEIPPAINGGGYWIRCYASGSAII